MTQTSNLLFTLALTLTGATTVVADDGCYLSHQRGYYSNPGSCNYAYSSRSNYGYSNDNYCPAGGCGMSFGLRYNDQFGYEPGYQCPSLRQSEFRDSTIPPQTPNYPTGGNSYSQFMTPEYYARGNQQNCPVTKKTYGSMGQHTQDPYGNPADFRGWQGNTELPNRNPLNSQPTDAPQQNIGVQNLGTDSHEGHDHAGHNHGESDKQPPFFSNQKNQFQSAFQIPEGMEGVSLLPPNQQSAALNQKTCPITNQPLGSMGKPIYVTTPIGSLFVCCEACIDKFKSNPQQYFNPESPSTQESGPINFAPPSSF